MRRSGYGNGANSFPAQMASCGKSALTWTLQWSSSKFKSCAQGKGLSSGCANCFEKSGKYGFDNCKSACMWSWCSSGCLSCVDRYKPQLNRCVGRELEAVPACSAAAGALEEEIVTSEKGSCSDSDNALMRRSGYGNGANSFPGQMASCGKSALTWTLQWSSSKFKSCAQGKGLSSGCANCFEKSGKYGVDNCKSACMWSWCSSGCLSCVNQYKPKLNQCVGRELEDVPSCAGAAGALDEEIVTSEKGSCSDSDNALMRRSGYGNGANSFPGQMASCGKSALTWTLQWSSSKFKSCAQGKGLSSGCANCFEKSGKYGFDNCKGACMFSWCSSGCLNCVNQYKKTLNQCVGH